MKSVIFFILFFFLTSFNYAQEECFEQITDAHILTIEESFQYIWMGTLENGLLIYDKWTEELIEFNTSNSTIPADKINSVFRYAGQTVYSTDFGVYQFDPLNLITISDTISGELGVTSDGHLIIAGSKDYYEWFMGDIVYHKDIQEEINMGGGDQTTDLIRTIDGEIWLSHYGFYEFDILQFADGIWTLHDINTTGVLPIESFSSHNRLMSYDGNIFATTSSPFEFTDNVWTSLYENGLTIIDESMDTLIMALTDLEADQQEGYWVGSMHNYLTDLPGRFAFYNDEVWQIFDLPISTPTDIIRLYSSYIVDHALYVGTSDGLFILDEVCLGVTGVEEIDIHEFVLYPNPSQDELKFKEMVYSAIQIYDVNGRLVKLYEKGNRNSVSINMLNPGNYFLQMIIKGKNVSAKFSVYE